MSANTLAGLMVLLINLDRSAHRRVQMEQRLADLGLAYTRLPAVDGKAHWAELVASVDVPLFERQVGRDLMMGEIGCYHSHLRAWQALIDSDCHTLLVLEDDVVFGEDFLPALREALDRRDLWDMLNLNKIRAKQAVRQAQLGPYALNAYMGPLTGMGAYLISRQTAQRLLPDMLPITLPIDLELDRVHRHRIRRYGLEPFPSHVDDEDQSTITGQAFSGVRKHVWYRRMPTFKRRLRDLVAKQWYLLRTGQLFPEKNKP
jgi:glycosyl transferase family 25